jgi:hypothetical protein
MTWGIPNPNAESLVMTERKRWKSEAKLSINPTEPQVKRENETQEEKIF